MNKRDGFEANEPISLPKEEELIPLPEEEELLRLPKEDEGDNKKLYVSGKITITLQREGVPTEVTFRFTKFPLHENPKQTMYKYAPQPHLPFTEEGLQDMLTHFWEEQPDLKEFLTNYFTPNMWKCLVHAIKHMNRRLTAI